MRGFIIGALVVAVVVLGYLYWQETRNDVNIKLEAPQITYELNANGGTRPPLFYCIAASGGATRLTTSPLISSPASLADIRTTSPSLILPSSTSSESGS